MLELIMEKLRENLECKADCEFESSDAAESGDVKRVSQKA